MTKEQLTDKEQLVAIIAEKMQCTKIKASEMINLFRDSLVDLIKKNGSAGYRIDGLGTFVTKVRPARKGRNPKTGEQMDIAARNNIVFRPSKALKDSVNE